MTKTIKTPGPRIYAFNKPAAMGSTDFLRRIKRSLTLKKEKIGHFGTLDPFAKGLFLIGVGGASRLNDLIHAHGPKTYTATGLFGVATDTGDCDGEEIAVEEISQIDQEKLNEALQSFLGVYSQKPPHFSATKHEGKALHEWAREGIKIDKPPVEREIFSIELVGYKHPEVQFKVTVSTGTYIRVLFEDICKKLGSVGHLLALERNAIGHIDLSMAIDHPCDDFDYFPKSFNQEIPFLKVQNVLKFPQYEINKEHYPFLLNGRELREEELTLKVSGELNGHIWLVDGDQALSLAVVEEGKVQPKINWVKYFV